MSEFAAVVGQALSLYTQSWCLLREEQILPCGLPYTDDNGTELPHKYATLVPASHAAYQTQHR